MTTPWTYAGALPALSHIDGAVTLVEGQTFCVSGPAGDCAPSAPHGLFVLDTRLVSRWEVRVDGQLLEPLTVTFEAPFEATFVTHATPSAGRADADLVVMRHRSIGGGMRERIVVRSYGQASRPVAVELRCDADFADLFEVKERRVPIGRARRSEVSRNLLSFAADESAKRTEIAFADAELVESGIVTWRFELDGREERELCVEVGVGLGGHAVPRRFRCGKEYEIPVPKQRLATWRQAVPIVDSDSVGLVSAVARTRDDLGALRIFDPDHPDCPVIAAGAPWFMAVFGRDSLLTGWMSLLADPTLGLGVVETLARFQGVDVNPATEEEPGRILHEMRFGAATGLALGGGQVYYGTIDATALFVMLLGELHRWGLSDQTVRRLLPHADAALAWIDDFGDRDGDGYVEYQRSTPSGLANQGWKDSWDGIVFADGWLAQPPIALCEVQGYSYAAFLARAEIARALGDEATRSHYLAKAARLKEAFNRDFWLDDRGWFAIGLDADKRPIDALASNMGHCLWTGIVDPAKATSVAEQLVSPAMFSGWGIRTLATSMSAYNPVSYHNGSVWPHDNALCAAGLMRYGFVEEAHRVIEGLLAVATANRGRLPELFAGLAREEISVPAAYPTSCVPQAWAAAAPLLLLRTMLRLDPGAVENELWIAPVLPRSIRRCRVEGVDVAGRRITIEVDDDTCEVTGTDGLHVTASPRPQTSGSVDN
jgi:glycogen debranching enzyme